MPNELDHLWKIDIKKASAVPPLIVRERLKAVIDKITGTSSRTYKQRGAIATDPRIIPVWNRKIVAEKICYEINREHPSIIQAFEKLECDQELDFELILKSIENSFPIDAIFSDVGSNPTGLKDSDMERGDMLAIAKISISIWRQQGIDEEIILANLKALDPIRNYWREIQSGIVELLKE